jgi:small-conductance mechanosensitive channel
VLAKFAAGIFLILLRPFKVGDFIITGGFKLAGPLLAVRPFCNNAHYWRVYFDANRTIRETFGEAGYPIPEQHYAVRGTAADPLTRRASPQ